MKEGTTWAWFRGGGPPASILAESHVSLLRPWWLSFGHKESIRELLSNKDVLDHAPFRGSLPAHVPPRLTRLPQMTCGRSVVPFPP